MFRIWHMKTITIQMVTAALGVIKKGVNEYLEIRHFARVSTVLKITLNQV